MFTIENSMQSMQFSACLVSSKCTVCVDAIIMGTVQLLWSVLIVAFNLVQGN